MKRIKGITRIVASISSKMTYSNVFLSSSSSSQSPSSSLVVAQVSFPVGMHGIWMKSISATFISFRSDVDEGHRTALIYVRYTVDDNVNIPSQIERKDFFNLQSFTETLQLLLQLLSVCERVGYTICISEMFIRMYNGTMYIKWHVYIYQNERHSIYRWDSIRNVITPGRWNKSRKKTYTHSILRIFCCVNNMAFLRFSFSVQSFAVGHPPFPQV